MRWSGRKSIPVCMLLLLVAGCSTTLPSALLRSPTTDSPRNVAREASNRDAPARVVHASLLAPTDATTVSPAHHQVNPDTPKQALSVDVLVEDVLARNPSLSQMVAAWQAASARYPQVRSWDDPMLSGMIAPSSFGSNSVEAGYRVELSQKIPFPGKLRLRGQGALSEASAAGNDVEDMRVQLIESTRLAFYEYYLAIRAIAVNEEGLQLLKQFRENADVRYKNGQVPQQDILQADVEIGRQQERGVTLDRMRKVAIARINTLRNSRVDGEVARGTSHVNQAPITGESEPVAKNVGDAVFAGTVNGNGALEIRTTKPAGETTLAHIIRAASRYPSHSPTC